MSTESESTHRPWPLPSLPWVMRQTWRDLLFMHWPVPYADLRALVPPMLEIERFAGQAWVSLSPFVVTGLRLRGLPAIPGLSSFPELNLRTYVTIEDKPGVYFFSLDAGSRVAVAGARTAYRLPYYHARMQARQTGRWMEYRSRRMGEVDAEFAARYRPVGDRRLAPVGTLDGFLTERYALYAVTPRGMVLRGEIDHPPWQLQDAEVVVERNTIAEAHGLPGPPVAPLVHFSRTQPTRVWPPIPVRARARVWLPRRSPSALPEAQPEVVVRTA